jgi:hypothetical protein
LTFIYTPFIPVNTAQGSLLFTNDQQCSHFYLHWKYTINEPDPTGSGMNFAAIGGTQ